MHGRRSHSERRYVAARGAGFRSAKTATTKQFAKQEQYQDAPSPKRYEDAVFEGRHKFAAQLNPEASALVLARANAWKTAFDTYAADCLGFAAYVTRQAKI
jgi:hypothetical protein